MGRCIEMQEKSLISLLCHVVIIVLLLSHGVSCAGHCHVVVIVILWLSYCVVFVSLHHNQIVCLWKQNPPLVFGTSQINSFVPNNTSVMHHKTKICQESSMWCLLMPPSLERTFAPLIPAGIFLQLRPNYWMGHLNLLSHGLGHWQIILQLSLIMLMLWLQRS